MEKIAGAPPGDEFALLRRQAVDALHAVLKPASYIGTAREAALAAVHVAAYPFGFLPAARLGASRPSVELARELLLAADPEAASMPVVMVHGYFHNRSAFIAIGRALRRTGLRNVECFTYNPLRQGIPELGMTLRQRVERILEESGAHRCQIVGHSMGGIVARWFVQELGGADMTDTVITLGTPHRGTYSAYLGPGPAATQMRPGSDVLRRLDESARPSAVRWISYYSNLDLLVTPAASAKLTHPALRATNVKIPDTGHLSFLLSGEVLRRVAEHLGDRKRDRPAPDTSAAPSVVTAVG